MAFVALKKVHLCFTLVLPAHFRFRLRSTPGMVDRHARPRTKESSSHATVATVRRLNSRFTRHGQTIPPEKRLIRPDSPIHTRVTWYTLFKEKTGTASYGSSKRSKQKCPIRDGGFLEMTHGRTEITLEPGLQYENGWTWSMA